MTATDPRLPGGGIPHPNPPRIGGLFEGFGGLTMAVRAVLGGQLSWYSEIDPGACALLEHREPDVPNLGDITTVPWHLIAVDQRVDVLAGGFPCQDVSLAGLMAGLMDGTRSGLWIEFARAIDELRPALVVIENVRGLCSAPASCDLEPCPWCVGDDEGVPLRALGAVLGDLADRGYDAQWCGLRAADVGAPHGRYRVFILAWRRDLAAHTAGDGRERHGDAWDGRAGSAHDGQPASDATSPRRGRAGSVASGASEGTPAETGGAVGRGGGAPAADADGGGQPGDQERDGRQDAARQGQHRLDPDRRVLAWGDYEPAIRRWEHVLGRSAPAPTELSARYLKIRAKRLAGLDRRPVGMRGSLNPAPHWQLAPRFVEWLMGLPEGWVCDVPGLTRNQMLRLLGNGVVPQQGAAALVHLLDQAPAFVRSWLATRHLSAAAA